MANWYDLTPERIEESPEALRQRAQAYHEALLENEVRRAVFMDMMGILRKASDDDAEPTYILALVDFFEEIKHRCGINDPLAVLDREAEVSARFEPGITPKEKRDLLEISND